MTILPIINPRPEGRGYKSNFSLKISGVMDFFSSVGSQFFRLKTLSSFLNLNTNLLPPDFEKYCGQEFPLLFLK
jgi:hypothetical protein